MEKIKSSINYLSTIIFVKKDEKKEKIVPTLCPTRLLFYASDEIIIWNVDTCKQESYHKKEIDKSSYYYFKDQNENRENKFPILLGNKLLLAQDNYKKSLLVVINCDIDSGSANFLKISDLYLPPEMKDDDQIIIPNYDFSSLSLGKTIDSSDGPDRIQVPFYYINDDYGDNRYRSSQILVNTVDFVSIVESKNVGMEESEYSKKLSKINWHRSSSRRDGGWSYWYDQNYHGDESKKYDKGKISCQCGVHLETTTFIIKSLSKKIINVPFSCDNLVYLNDGEKKDKRYQFVCFKMLKDENCQTGKNSDDEKHGQVNIDDECDHTFCKFAPLEKDYGIGNYYLLTIEGHEDDDNKIKYSYKNLKIKSTLAESYSLLEVSPRILMLRLAEEIISINLSEHDNVGDSEKTKIEKYSCPSTQFFKNTKTGNGNKNNQESCYRTLLLPRLPAEVEFGRKIILETTNFIPQIVEIILNFL
jgi:hypothetical protein